QALESLGYSPDKISSFTKSFMGKPASGFIQSHHTDTSNLLLPNIVVPCAYLFANTERSNLVTEVEVNPEMLSIRVYALGRFTPEWRSSVPGYVRSTVNQNSIKNFTFELSKFKKLLHAKSFVYDFQLRYVAYLLKPADSVSLALREMAQKTSSGRGGLSVNVHSSSALYSSESEDETPSGFSNDLDSDGSDLEGATHAGNNTSRPQNIGVDGPVSDRVPVPHLCTDVASHSGCYRLYDGIASEFADHHVFGSDIGSDTDSHLWQSTRADRPSYFYSGSHGHKSSGGVLSGVPIASSAPVPASRMDHTSQRSSDIDNSKQPHLHPFNSKGRGQHLYIGTDLAKTHSHTTGTQLRLDDGGKQEEVTIAAGPRKADGSNRARGKHPDYSIHRHGTMSSSNSHYMNTHSVAGYPTMMPSFSPTPLYNSSSADHAAKNSNRHTQHPQASTWKDLASGQKSIDQESNEYSLSRIHLTSIDSSVCVSLMALTPDCDTCIEEDHLELQRRKERHMSHSDISYEKTAKKDRESEQRHRHHHRHHRRRRHCDRHRNHDSSQQASVEGLSELRYDHNVNGRGDSRDRGPSAIDDIAGLFGHIKGKSALSMGHKNRTYNPHMPAATATDISGPGQNTSKSVVGSGGIGDAQKGHLHKRKGQSQSSYSGQQQQSYKHHVHPFQRWMESLSSNVITDPQMDGLYDQQQIVDSDNCQSHMRPTVYGPAQLSYYLVIDMDPQTTFGLSNLHASSVRSRNGSLGQLPDCLSDSPGSADEKMSMYGMRQCGEVWANEPTMVMEVSNIDPKEYDKEDPDVLRWIKKTARRIIKHTAIDYHRNINWYRICQQLHMADLPTFLVPSDVLELVGFIERRDREDVCTFDDSAQQLVLLDIPAERVIRSLQLRMRHLYLESALLMSSLCAHPTLKHSSAERMPLQDSGIIHPHAAATGLGAVTTPPSSPVALFVLSRSRIRFMFMSIRTRGNNNNGRRHSNRSSGGGRGGRSGMSISSLIGFDPIFSSSTQSQTQAVPTGATDTVHPHSYGSSVNKRSNGPNASSAAGAVDPSANGSSMAARAGSGTCAAASDGFFVRPLVEALPGSLLIIDPESGKYLARLILLNPFSCHSVLELLFERKADGTGTRLSGIYTISRDRRRSGLYEHERKHINMVLSTVSAVVWDVLTQNSQ
ncbi:hypothetical protein GGH99_005021, partial [Coemansia sp. RSA 1285]